MEKIYTLHPNEYPPLLQEITDPPEKLHIRGNLPQNKKLRWLAVVGSRKYTSYGSTVCEKLITGLRGAPVVIVSGLALGIDSLAHKAALAAELPTVAVPGSGLNWDVLYPRNHTSLARQILEHDGALVSEFDSDFKATPWSFPQRNRIMAGLSHAVLVIEGIKKSGTMITVRLATEYNRDVLAVPGPITAPASVGTNWLIQDGATPITSSEDIFEALKIDQQPTTDNKQLLKNLPEGERKVVELLNESLSRDELIRKLNMPINETNILLSAMELKGLITEKLGKVQLK